MAPLGFVLLVNRGNLTKVRLYRAIRERLQKEPGCDPVRVRPSRARPRSVEATVHPEQFSGGSYPTDQARLVVSFSYPESADYEYYRLQWVDDERSLGLGWHRDEPHPELGECHLQLDHSGTTVERAAAEFLDEHPLEVLETRLDDLRSVLGSLRWTDGQPRLAGE